MIDSKDERDIRYKGVATHSLRNMLLARDDEIKMLQEQIRRLLEGYKHRSYNHERSIHNKDI